ncbi:PEP-CTERM sorting domain-containing protein [Cyanothece sp. BG0011]|uniref:PEP-CTERM sorting domain-containing protein n=1 Tax=Cyanothece sp. BG0011 TaxID=2082950 RepID=UPI000D1E8996|nr:PEP-CTERM sorting domain-containing protein [Cyanothece sp. BG0011]
MNTKYALTAIATTALSLTVVDVAHAATFNFSFSGDDGPVLGTVMGTIELPDAALTTDGNYQATSVIVTSAPTELGYSFPLDVLNGVVSVTDNSFNVINGLIVDSTFQSQITGNALFALSADVTGNSYLTDIGNEFTFIENTGVLDNLSSTLRFSSATATVPEPASVLGLLSLGALGLGLKGKKKA